ncbi:MAG: hypothetical protein ACP5N3_05345 [Candidatus Nanoarchaeia archaeon]
MGETETTRCKSCRQNCENYSRHSAEDTGGSGIRIEPGFTFKYSVRDRYLFWKKQEGYLISTEYVRRLKEADKDFCDTYHLFLVLPKENSIFNKNADNKLNFSLDSLKKSSNPHLTRISEIYLTLAGLQQAIKTKKIKLLSEKEAANLEKTITDSERTKIVSQLLTENGTKKILSEHPYFAFIKF